MRIGPLLGFQINEFTTGTAWSKKVHVACLVAHVFEPLYLQSKLWGANNQVANDLSLSPVHSLWLVQFTKGVTGAAPRGSYIAVQVPNEADSDWSKWILKRSNDQLYRRRIEVGYN